MTGLQSSAEQPKPDLVDRFLAEENMSAAERQKRALQRVGAEFQRAEGDTGSTEVQGAMLPLHISCAGQFPHGPADDVGYTFQSSRVTLRRIPDSSLVTLRCMEPQMWP
jgi:hypothetical protein